MTTKKSDQSPANNTASSHKAISKHKATRRVVQATPQAFDIIPRDQVRPSSNARPVIPSTQPEVSDNTLTTAPRIQLGHQTRLQPGNDDTPAPVTVQSGVSVTDLLAKRREAVDVSPTPTASPAVDVSNASNATDATDADSNSTVDAKTESPSPASDTSKPPETTVTAEVEAAPIADSKPTIAETNSEAPAGSLKNALKDDTVNPQTHSEVLKSALNDLDTEDSPHHRELYGGKPVIVIHKAHSQMSALNWVLWFIICLGLAVLLVNFLLDAGVIATTYNVPHTDWL